MREPNEADPQSLTDARQTETEWIAKWIDQYQGTDFFSQVTGKTKSAAIEGLLASATN